LKFRISEQCEVCAGADKPSGTDSACHSGLQTGS
jgi:hypothetical protein